MCRSAIMDGFPDPDTVVVPFSGYAAYTFAFNKKGPAGFFFLVHPKHLFPPVIGFSSNIPNSPCQWVAFQPSADLMVSAFYPSIHNQA
jgi:hypothetical protein